MGLARGFLDLLFPARCPGCRELLLGEAPFCRVCRETLTEVPPEHCPRCGEPGAQALCVHCQARTPAFEKASAPFLYGGALADALHRLKYEDCPHYALPVAQVLREHARVDLEWCTVVAPVSLHPRRLRRRGYDQALQLARTLACEANRPVVARAVRRVRETEPQVGKSRPQRERNVDGAFVAEPCAIRGQRVLLVDDVLTTGATAHAAARACLDAGAEAVRVVAAARAG